MPFDARQKRQIIRFAGVGSVGFVVDFMLTWGLTRQLGLQPAFSRIIAILVAMSVTYLLNRRFTFQARHGQRGREVTRYFAVNVTGATVNYGVFRLCLLVAPLLGLAPTSVFTLGPAIVAGSGSAMCLNYLGSHFFVFTR